jgi:WD40 repeat protein
LTSVTQHSFIISYCCCLLFAVDLLPYIPTAAGDDRLYVCCNDSTVKVFALPSMSSVTVLHCPCPINYVALSPDGNTLVAVGDTDTTYLYQATPAGDQGRGGREGVCVGGGVS